MDEDKDIINNIGEIIQDEISNADIPSPVPEQNWKVGESRNFTISKSDHPSYKSKSAVAKAVIKKYVYNILSKNAYAVEAKVVQELDNIYTKLKKDIILCNHKGVSSSLMQLLQLQFETTTKLLDDIINQQLANPSYRYAFSVLRWAIEKKIELLNRTIAEFRKINHNSYNITLQKRKLNMLKKDMKKSTEWNNLFKSYNNTPSSNTTSPSKSKNPKSKKNSKTNNNICNNNTTDTNNNKTTPIDINNPNNNTDSPNNNTGFDNDSSNSNNENNLKNKGDFINT